MVVGNRVKGTFLQVSGALPLCISLLSSSLHLKFQPPWPSPPLISSQLSEMVVLCPVSPHYFTPAKCLQVGSQGLCWFVVPFLSGITVLACRLLNVWKLFPLFCSVFRLFLCGGGSSSVLVTQWGRRRSSAFLFEPGVSTWCSVFCFLIWALSLGVCTSFSTCDGKGCYSLNSLWRKGSLPNLTPNWKVFPYFGKKHGCCDMPDFLWINITGHSPLSWPRVYGCSFFNIFMPSVL